MPRFLALLVVSIIFSFQAEAQDNITGRIVDHENGTPVKYAQVKFKGTFCGTATNRNGEFTLNTAACTGHELMITAPGYDEKVISLSKARQPIEISLQKQPWKTAFRPDQKQIHAVIESMVLKFAGNYHTTNYRVTSFHREYVRSFDNIIQLMEGVMTSENSGGIDVPIARNFLYAEDKDHREHFWHPSHGGFYTFGWQPISPGGTPSATRFLGVHLRNAKDLLKYYEFHSPGTIRNATGTVYVIRFDQKDNLKAALWRGTLFVDSATHALSKIEYEMSPKGLNYVRPNVTSGMRICTPPLRMEIVRESGEYNYQRIGSRWYLANQVLNAQFNASLDSIKSNRNEHFMKIRMEKVITAFDTVAPGERSATVTRTSMPNHNYIKSNYESYESPRTEWPGDLILKADTSIFEAVRILRLNNQLWERKEGRKALVALKSSTTFTPDQLKNDLRFLKEMFFGLHPALSDHAKKSHFSRVTANAERHIQRNTTENEFYRLIVPAIEGIHCGHTQVLPSRATQDYNRRFGKYFPFELTVIGRRAFLLDVVADSAAGSELLKINGEDMASVLDNLRYRVSTEGVSESDKDYLLGRKFADLYSVNYLQTDSFKICLKDFKTKQVGTYTFAASGYRVRESMSSEPVTTIDSIQTVILRFPNYNSDFSMKGLMDKIVPMINQSRYANMIIDLRDTPSFRERDAAELHSYLSPNGSQYIVSIALTSADTTLYQRLWLNDKKFREAAPGFSSSIISTDSTILYSGHPRSNEDGPRPAVFSGNLFVIVNGGSSSAAVDLAKILQTQKRAVVVGQETFSSFHGTCDSGTASFVLPHSGLRMTLPFATYKLDASLTKDMRLVPDHVAEYEIDDLVAKKDPELEICRNLILASCCSAKSN